MSLLAAVLVTGCDDMSKRKPQSWYDEAKDNTRLQNERVAQLMGQGLTRDDAMAAFALEQAIQNTEHPPDPKGWQPVEGQELKDALQR